MSEEADLIERCRRGDGPAWDIVFDEHYAATGRFVFQLSPTISHEDAEEICQEVFFSLIRHVDTFHRSCRLRTWIFRIAANKTRDYLESRRTAKRGGGRELLPLNVENENGQVIDPPDPLPAPDTALLSAEQKVLLRKSLDQLGDPCREIIELRYFGDLSYEDISATLKLNPKTVSSRLSKCLDHLEKIARKVFSGVEPRPYTV